MDALFIIVAELLIVPLILWALILLELTVGVAASVLAIFAGRCSPSEAVLHSWRSIRRKLLWSLIFVSSGLLLADLVFFDQIVHLALSSADDREDLDVHYGHAEGSFIFGHIELHQLSVRAVRGGDEPSARVAFAADHLLINIDTKRLLTLNFVVNELSVDGVRGSFDRLRPSDAKPERGSKLAHEFLVERLHLGDVLITVRDSSDAAEPPREVEIVIAELDLGPIASESLVFDLLYRARGRGSVGGHDFTLTSVEDQGVHQTTLEVEQLPLGALAKSLERSAGVRAKGSADLRLVNRYIEGTPGSKSEPKLEMSVALQLRALELEAVGEAKIGTQLMLKMAQRELKRLGAEFPLTFQVTLLRSELMGLQSIAESGIIAKIADALAAALRSQLTRRERGK